MAQARMGKVYLREKINAVNINHNHTARIKNTSK
jgi:hypothetical protein